MFRLGSDPEYFLVDNNGKHISVIGMVGADKWNPRQLEEMEPGFTVQEDNVAVEFGIPPASSGLELYANLFAVKTVSQKLFPGLKFSKLSAVVFDKDQLLHPAAQQFGCEPDFDAWLDPTVDKYGNAGNINPKPTADNCDLRSAGGHIHIETTEEPLAVVRSMDLFLGVPSVLMDEGDLRKQLYGKRGAHRVKPYGVEYRVLSNYWTESKELCTWVWRNTERALKNIGSAEFFDERIREAINNNNKTVAEELVYECGLDVVRQLEVV